MKTSRIPRDNNQAAFLAEVGKLWPAAKGSVSEIHKPCVRVNCRACAEEGGRRAFIFSYKDGKRRRCLYVPADLVQVVHNAVANGRKIEQLLSRAGAQMILENRRKRKGENKP